MPILKDVGRGQGIAHVSGCLATTASGADAAQRVEPGEPGFYGPGRRRSRGLHDRHMPQRIGASRNRPSISIVLADERREL
jgi:hypothetical protein